MIPRALDDRTPRYRLALRCPRGDRTYYVIRCGADDRDYFNGSGGLAATDRAELALGYATYDEAEVDREQISAILKIRRCEIEPIPNEGGAS